VLQTDTSHNCLDYRCQKPFRPFVPFDSLSAI